MKNSSWIKFSQINMKLSDSKMKKNEHIITKEPTCDNSFCSFYCLHLILMFIKETQKDAVINEGRIMFFLNTTWDYFKIKFTKKNNFGRF